ncbi:MAG: hypothetical protein JWN20_672 [Jatrophihabitantaceae bacterium]|nr:hypothetical protein [Jatrophihabitantaceae bacterium]
MHLRRTTLGFLATLLALAACTDNTDNTGNEGNKGSSSASTDSTNGTSRSASPSLSASPTPSASPISGECGSVLPISALEQVMGIPVIGKTNFIVGTPEPDIDRISYLNCRYGLADAVAGQPEPVAQVEVGVSAYGSPGSASARVQGTVEAYRGQGATQSTVAVGAASGTLLIGSGEPTLVLAAGNKTVAVTVLSALLPADKRDAILSGIAQRALTGAGG